MIVNGHTVRWDRRHLSLQRSYHLLVPDKTNGWRFWNVKVSFTRFMNAFCEHSFRGWINDFWCALSAFLGRNSERYYPVSKDLPETSPFLTTQIKTSYHKACKPLGGERSINYSGLADVLRSKSTWIYAIGSESHILLVFMMHAGAATYDAGAFTGVINLGLSSSQPLW